MNRHKELFTGLPSFEDSPVIPRESLLDEECLALYDHIRASLSGKLKEGVAPFRFQGVAYPKAGTAEPASSPRHPSHTSTHRGKRKLPESKGGKGKAKAKGPAAKKKKQKRIVEEQPSEEELSDRSTPSPPPINLSDDGEDSTDEDYRALPPALEEDDSVPNEEGPHAQSEEEGNSDSPAPSFGLWVSVCYTQS